MQPAFLKYIADANRQFQTGLAKEHAYRGPLQNLLTDILPKDVVVTNEPKRTAVGAPDYILLKKDIPAGYIEAKDIGIDLEKTDRGEQMSRYKQGFDNLVLTDYLEFWFYRGGQLRTKIRLAEVVGGSIQLLDSSIPQFLNQILDFAHAETQSIKSAPKLAEMMANKARIIQETIERALLEDQKLSDESTAHRPPLTALQQELATFKQILIHDIDEKQFADVYAQTIAYGLFAARVHDPTLPTFSRLEAAQLLPESNPFLRKLFHHIAGFDVDQRITWIIDDLVDIFRAADVAAILKNFGEQTGQTDPIVHFYETFLALYNPALRKSRGVWYTPAPVVQFIVRAVDELLKTEFGIEKGLLDASKIKMTTKVATKATMDMRSKTKLVDHETEVHRVQLLDPAAGTGTFLAEVIKFVFQKFKAMPGAWPDYARRDLLPRLNGFEVMMASYAMAHLKIDLLLAETGFRPAAGERLRIFLTNSLEESHPDTGTLFATFLAEESEQANRLKRDVPVMVVLGNPPYSGHSANKGEWQNALLKDYKIEPGGGPLQEKNSKWLNDDYVKFIRLAEHTVAKNGEGIVAYITNHSYLDNPTFRGMRWQLLQTFDKIWVIDLHGNAKKKEKSPDGSPDENVFDIMQGVSIFLGVKKKDGKKGQLAELHGLDLYGKREDKYDFLDKNSFKTVAFHEIQANAPFFFFQKKEEAGRDEYENGLALNELFPVNGVGMTTAHDEFVIDENKKKLIEKFTDFKSHVADPKALHQKFNVAEKNGWSILDGWKNLQNQSNLDHFIQPVTYRPFDNRFIFYENKLVWRTVFQVNQHFLKGKNLGLVIGRQGQVVGDMLWNLSFITKSMTDFNLFYRGGGMLFPLYLYPDITQTNAFDQQPRQPNLSPKIVEQIAKGLGLRFEPEPTGAADAFSPLDLLDYIYAVLHSPAYRAKYREFLKIDFPRVPYPTDAGEFRRLVKLGGELRQYHLMEHPKSEDFVTTFPNTGSNAVEKPRYDEATQRVWINDGQYFDGVEKSVWEFYIGGYQPAQKWLKDRRGRALSYEDIAHWMKIVVALGATGRLMSEIDA